MGEPLSKGADQPISINGWSPRNSNGGFAGEITLRQAFAQSINTVSVRIAQEVHEFF